MSIKSMGKIAAVAAAAGLILTGCANDDASQARAQEETCGVFMGANAKANEALNRAMQSGEAGAERAASILESAALDIRNHSFDRTDSATAPGSDETIPLRTTLQVQAEFFDEMASAVKEDGVEAMNTVVPEDIEVNGMTYQEATDNLTAYCGSYFGA